MKTKSIGITSDGKFINVDKRKLKSIARRMRKGDAFKVYHEFIMKWRRENK